MESYSGELTWKGSGVMEKHHFTHYSEIVIPDGKMALQADIDLRDTKENFSFDMGYDGTDKMSVNVYMKNIGTKSDTAKDVVVPKNFIEATEEAFRELLKDL